MRLKKEVMTIAICIVAMLSNGGIVFAQEARQEKAPKARTQVIVQGTEPMIAIQEHADGFAAGMAMAQRENNTFVYLSSEMSFNDKVVKGAPYSAQAITESIQTLGDGNRIVRKSTASVYRDSEGRTRRDQKIDAIGPWNADGDAPQLTFIHDPVAGVSYVFDTQERTARKMPSFHTRIGGPDGDTVVVAPMRRPGMGIEERRKIELEMAPNVAMRKPADPDRVKTESLGKQVIEGVEAEGTRTTVTIPAGEIGNEQAINIVSEKWYSPDLQVVVMRKHSDPRMGENTYRLTGINRSEPARSLFEVPAEYTVKEGHGGVMAPRSMRTKKPRTNQDQQ